MHERHDHRGHERSGSVSPIFAARGLRAKDDTMSGTGLDVKAKSKT
jgi:hypothetical protein